VLFRNMKENHRNIDIDLRTIFTPMTSLKIVPPLCDDPLHVAGHFLGRLFRLIVGDAKTGVLFGRVAKLLMCAAVKLDRQSRLRVDEHRCIGVHFEQLLKRQLPPGIVGSAPMLLFEAGQRVRIQLLYRVFKVR
jgi:hypothetical protein